MKWGICIILILWVPFLSSCKEDEVAPGSPYLHGDVEGYVKLYTYDTISRSNAGVKVSIEGTSFSATTDDRGHWKISGISTGSYTFRFERDTFGYIRVFNYPFVGGGSAVVPDVQLSEIDLGQMNLLEMDGRNGCQGVAVEIHRKTNYGAQVAVVIDPDSTLLANRPEYATLFLIHDLDAYFRNYGDTLDIQINTDTEISAIFPAAKKGQPLFCRAAFSSYTYDVYQNTQFVDPYVNRRIYSGLSPYSNIIRIQAY